jgi:hypothetical protein
LLPWPSTPGNILPVLHGSGSVGGSFLGHIDAHIIGLALLGGLALLALIANPAAGGGVLHDAERPGASAASEGVRSFCDRAMVSSLKHFLTVALRLVGFVLVVGELVGVVILV